MHHGIDWIHKSLSAVMGDPRYALLNAKRLCDMVIDVLVAAELLAQAPLSEAKRALATSFIHRRMLVVETNARRIARRRRVAHSALRHDPRVGCGN